MSITLSTSNWTPIGPAPLDTAGGLGPISGRIEAAAPDPTNAKVLYVGGNNGGIWKNINPPGWVPLTDFQPSLNFGGYHPLIVHPANPDLILGAVSGPGAGILQSTDAGTSWQLLANSQFEGASLGSLAVHPTDTSLLYLSAGWRGVWTSTDGGVTWTQLSALPGGNATDVIIARFNPKYLYAGVVGNNAANIAQNGVYQSTDGGATWAPMSGLPSGAALGINPAAGAVRLESGSGVGVVYASILTTSPLVPPQSVTAVQRFKTTDGGTTWKALNPSGGSLEARSWHLLLAVDPKDDKHIFANDAYSLWESTDSGKKWAQADVGIGWLSFINHFDWVNMAFDANTNAIATADQGVFRYNLPKGTWTSLIGNLQVSEFYTITLDPNSREVVYTVGQDIFAQKFTGSIEWNVIEGSINETGKILVDPHNSSQLCASNPLDIKNLVRQSSDAGASWTTIFSKSQLSVAFQTLYAKQAGGSGGDYTFAYAAQKAFAMDPTNPARVLFGADQVFESTNIGSASPTWTPISGTLSLDPSNPFVISLAIAPSDPNTVYAATQDGHLWVTYNDGLAWTECDSGLSGNVLDVRVDPLERTHAFAVTGNDVWQLSPPGVSWSKITGNIPGYLGLKTIFVDWRGAVPRLFVGTNRGVYQSANLGVTWTKFDAGLPNTTIGDLQAHTYEHKGRRHLVLAAATYGRGAWEILLRPWGAIATSIADSGYFGDVCPGSFRDELLTINNNGSGPLLITGITSSSFEFLAPSVLSYPLLVGAGDSIDVMIRFQPSNTGFWSGTITILSDDPDGPHNIPVSGQAPAPRLNLLIANSGNFGNVCVGSFRDEPLVLNNSGKCAVSIFSITSTSGDFLTPSVFSYPLVIGAGDSMPVPIRFAPSSFGAKSAVITVTANDPSGTHTIDVSGDAPSGKLAVSGSLCFGGVKACCRAERTLSICNVGDCSLHVTSVAFKRKSPFWKLINNPFPATLHPGSCLGVVIRYKATEKCPVCCELVITSDDPLTPVKTLDVMAYTVWEKCDCKCHCEPCCEGCADDCCQDEKDDD